MKELVSTKKFSKTRKNIGGIAYKAEIDKRSRSKEDEVWSEGGRR